MPFSDPSLPDAAKNRFIGQSDKRLDATSEALLEKEIFDELPPMSEEVSGRICRLVLMQVLPALAEKNCSKFGSAITEIQTLVGEHFSDAQNGHYSSQRVAEIMHWLSDRGATGIG